MNDGNAIFSYYQKIEDGSIVVGKWIRMLYETIVDGLESKRWFFDERRANMAIRFIEKYCHHYKGKLAPNAPSTIARKGHDKPLIDTGTLKASIDYEVK